MPHANADLLLDYFFGLAAWCIVDAVREKPTSFLYSLEKKPKRVAAMHSINVHASAKVLGKQMSDFIV